jgi:hypothetical protein
MSTKPPFGDLKIPFEIAMQNETSQRLFYDRVQQLLDCFDERKDATVEGCEIVITILSELVDEQRAILVDVDQIFGVDGDGRMIEDGKSVLIDRIRTSLAMTRPYSSKPNGCL